MPYFVVVILLIVFRLLIAKPGRGHYPDASCLAANLEENLPLATKRTLWGITISKQAGMFSCLFGGGEDRNLTLPKRPTRFQKAIAYVLVMMGYAFWARQEGQFINYAFRVNAGDILKW